MNPTKTCSKCKQAKSGEEFHKNSKSKDGLQSMCKLCKAKAKGYVNHRKRFPPTNYGFKYCRKCETLKPTTDFLADKKSLDKMTSWCKSCLTDRIKHTISIKRNIFQAFKMQPCGQCRQKFDITTMDFDHLNPHQKISNVSGMVRKWSSVHKFIKEIKKCDVVCVTCHRKRTWIRNRAKELGAYNVQFLPDWSQVLFFDSTKSKPNAIMNGRNGSLYLPSSVKPGDNMEQYWVDLEPGWSENITLHVASHVLLGTWAASSRP